MAGAFMRGLLSGAAGGVAGMDEYIRERGKEQREEDRVWTLEEFREAKEMERLKMKEEYERDIADQRTATDMYRANLSAETQMYVADSYSSRGLGGGGGGRNATEDIRQYVEADIIRAITAQYLQPAGVPEWGDSANIDEYISQLQSIADPSNGNRTQANAARSAIREAMRWKDKLAQAEKQTDLYGTRKEAEGAFGRYWGAGEGEDAQLDDFDSFMRRD